MLGAQCPLPPAPCPAPRPLQIRIYCVSRSLDSFNLGPSCGLSAYVLNFVCTFKPASALASSGLATPAVGLQKSRNTRGVRVSGGQQEQDEEADEDEAAACAWPGISAD